MTQARISTFMSRSSQRPRISVFSSAKCSGWGLALCAFVAIAGQFTAAATQVSFSATVYGSPFTTPGYTVGSTVTGTFDYTPGTAPFATGANYTDYYIASMQVYFGAAQYNSTFVELEASHNITFDQFSNVDAFTVWGYSLTGPNVEGYQPASSGLWLLDTDHSIYAPISPPYPLDLPNQALFENKTLRVTFYNGQAAQVYCTVDSITVVPEPNGSHILMVCALLGLAAHRKRRSSQAATT
jgi:hypothetical protein